MVKELDPNREFTTRMEYFADPAGMARFFDAIDREVLTGNTFLRWLLSVVRPTYRGD